MKTKASQNESVHKAKENMAGKTTIGGQMTGMTAKVDAHDDFQKILGAAPTVDTAPITVTTGTTIPILETLGMTSSINKTQVYPSPGHQSALPILCSRQVPMYHQR